jgi:type I restriction enzyme, S subunit
MGIAEYMNQSSTVTNSQLKEGYKQTEVGVIPEDWDVASIGSLASFTSGLGINIATLQAQSSDNPIPVYGGNGVAGYTKDYLKLEPTVVIGRVGQKCGEVYFTDGSAWITDNALYPRVISQKLDVQFLSLALKSAGLNNFRNQNDLPLVTQAILHSVRILLPPTKAEQEAIASTLSDIDALIESLDRLLTKKRQIKQGAMQELLRSKEGWETTNLGSLGSFTKGSGVRKDESLSGSLPCIRYGEIYTKHDDYIKHFYSWISSNVAETATRLKTGDLLFSGSGETKEAIGKCVAFINDIEAYSGGDIVILRLENSNAQFMGYYLNTSPVVRQKSSKGQGDAVVHIGASTLASIQVTIPTLEEQEAIANILSDMDTEIDSISAKLTKTRQLKQGMMHELLTGRIRLVDRTNI